MKKLTPEQIETLIFIYTYTRRKGLSPTAKEIGSHFFLSRNAANYRCIVLFRKGYLMRTAHAQRNYYVNFKSLCKWAHS